MLSFINIIFQSFTKISCSPDDIFIPLVENYKDVKSISIEPWTCICKLLLMCITCILVWNKRQSPESQRGHDTNHNGNRTGCTVRFKHWSNGVWRNWIGCKRFECKVLKQSDNAAVVDWSFHCMHCIHCIYEGTF